MASRGHMTSRLGLVAVVSPFWIKKLSHSTLLKINTIRGYLYAVTGVQAFESKLTLKSVKVKNMTMKQSYWFILSGVIYFLLSNIKISNSSTKPTFKKKGQLVLNSYKWTPKLQGVVSCLNWFDYSFLFSLLFVKTFTLVNIHGFTEISKHEVQNCLK